MISANPFDKKEFPNCHEGHNYALDVVSGKVIACSYVIGACNRYLKDLGAGFFIMDKNKAERYMRLTQKFNHVKGANWKTENITYEPWQKFALLNVLGWVDPRTNNRRFRIAHVEIPRGQGKANWIGENVPTPDGFKKWGEIEVGSRLFSRDGSICNVVKKTPTTKQKAYKLIFSDGSEVIASAEHEWYTTSKAQRDKINHHKKHPPKRLNKNNQVVASFEYESIVETLQIKNSLTYGKEVNHLVSNTKPTVGEISIKDKIDPYFLGYWLGNGSRRTSNLSCHKDDAEELMEILRNRGISSTLDGYQKPGNGKTIKVYDQITKLKSLGICESKEVDLNWYNLKIDERLELLRGLLDSDGTICKNLGTVDFSVSDFKMAYLVKLICCSLGFKAVLSERKISSNNNFKPTKKHYRVAFSARSDLVLFNLKRKRERQISKIGTHTYSNNRYIKDVIELDEYLEMFCVEVDSKDNTYLIGDSFIPTHNSLIASQMVLWFLALDNPKGNEISCAGTKTDQARIVLDSARAMAKGCPSYLSSTGVKVLAHKIVHEKSNSFVRALSSDDKSLDGLNDVLCVIDELHVVSRSMFDVIYSGLSKRNDSLLFCITTAGTNTDGIGYSQSVYAKKVALGDHKDDQFFSLVYSIDEGDDIFSEETWKKANPNYGVSVDPITFAAKASKAKITPSDLPNFKTKHLNVWVSEVSAYYDPNAWDKCADPSLSIDQFKGERCYVGIDIASKVDLTSFAILFRKDGHYYFFDRTYIPKATANEVKSVLYDDAIAKGYLIATDGEAISYDILEEDFKEISRNHNLISGLFDPWGAIQFAQKMMQERIEMKEFRMTTANLSEATKTLDALMRQGKIHHNGSPLAKWCISNVVAKEDAAGNVFPKKSTEKLKIDIAIALIMALAAWLQEDAEDSVYESRGPIFL